MLAAKHTLTNALLRRADHARNRLKKTDPAPGGGVARGLGDSGMGRRQLNHRHSASEISLAGRPARAPEGLIERYGTMLAPIRKSVRGRKLSNAVLVHSNS